MKARRNDSGEQKSKRKADAVADVDLARLVVMSGNDSVRFVSSNA